MKSKFSIRLRALGALVIIAATGGRLGYRASTSEPTLVPVYVTP